MPHRARTSDLFALFVSGALLAASPAAAQPTSTAAPPTASSQPLGGLTVWSGRPRNPERLLRLDMHSASSCAFSPGSLASHIEDYIASVTGVVSVGLGVAHHSPDLETLPPGYTSSYFRPNSLFGPDASQDVRPFTPPFFTLFGPEPPRDYCSSADMRFLAGRAHIARRDTFLPQGFALYEGGNYPQALTMFHKAYRKLPDRDGGVEAALMIGRIHLGGGSGGRTDMQEAIRWLTRAGGAAFRPVRRISYDPRRPDRGYTPIGEASVLLGQIYLTGHGGVPRDPKAARRWFDRAYDSGYLPAGKTVGDIHFYGYDGVRDTRKALRYYQEAASLGFGPAQAALGDIYYYGADGIAQDRAKGLAWYNAAAAQEHPEALHSLAVAYDTGEGVAADPQKALGFYKAAALAGSRDARAAMGTYFYEGRLVPRDHAAARKWFETAAIQGQPDAMYNLAAMMTRGEGGGVDRTRAWVWFNIARQGGLEKAPMAISTLERRMSPEELASAQALFSPTRS